MREAQPASVVLQPAVQEDDPLRCDPRAARSEVLAPEDEHEHVGRVHNGACSKIHGVGLQPVPQL